MSGCGRGGRGDGNNDTNNCNDDHDNGNAFLIINVLYANGD